MKSTVIVVEGQAEFIFVQTLIQKLATQLKYSLNLSQYRNRFIASGTRGYPQQDADFKLHLIDVGGDDRVRSFIEEFLPAFRSQNTDLVLGLRDCYTGSKKKPAPNIGLNAQRDVELSQQHNLYVSITIACQELEAWFLAVPAFFAKLDAGLTMIVVNLILGYDLTACDVEAIAHPSAEIDKVLKTVKLGYSKKEHEVQSIVGNLDFEELYLDQCARVPSWNKFAGNVDRSLS